MVENQNRALLILCGLVVTIVFGLAIKLQPVMEKSQATGVQMAKVWMLDSVQRYKEAWLLQGEPKQMEMDGFHLTMTEGGLVSPFNQQGGLDCAYWLAVHYPQRKIMTSEPSEVGGTIKNNFHICNYTYKHHQVKVTASRNHLTISVEKLAK
ncbi:MAG: MSHA biogenesis protein MshF [Vibrionaceae bacterium]|nr:MSHA biogenesis protein MshF [Vibrionaceae bacterium]